MSDFKWNQPNDKVVHFWNEDRNGEDSKHVVESDKQLIMNPTYKHSVDVLSALCRVVSELVEIEEKRADDRKS